MHQRGDEVSNGWFVPVDTAFIIVIVRPAPSPRQGAERDVAAIKTDITMDWQLIAASKESDSRTKRCSSFDLT